MQIFLYLLYGVEFVIAVLLILVILIQRSKSGGGLGGLATTSSGVEEAFGSDAGNVLTRVTWFLGAFFLVTTITIGILQGFISKSDDRDMGGEDYMGTTDTGQEEKGKNAAGAKGDGATDKKTDEKTDEKTDDKSGEKADDTKAGDPKPTEK